MNRMLLLLACLTRLLLTPALAEDQPLPSSTTGMPISSTLPVTMVQISGTSPETWGLSKADVVYETIIAGPGYTGYTAIFCDDPPAYVGPLAGTRVLGIQLQQAWQCPYIFHGALPIEDAALYPYMKEHAGDGLVRIDTTKEHAFVDNAPDSIQYQTFNLADYIASTADPSSMQMDNNGFQFLPEGETLDIGIRVDTVSFAYNRARRVIVYQYSPDTMQYRRMINGQPQIDAADGSELHYSNVLVMCTDLYYEQHDQERPMIHLTGAGPMTAYIQGRKIEGIWVHQKADDPIKYFDTDGNLIKMQPGKTFVQVVPASMYYSKTYPIDYDNRHEYLAPDAH